MANKIHRNRKKYQMKRTVKFIPLSKEYFAPTKSDEYAIGYDVYAPEDIKIPAHSRAMVPLGFGIQLPYGIECKIESRSGFAAKGFEGYGAWKERRKLFGIIPYWKTLYGKHRFNADVISGKIDPAYQDKLNVVIKNDDGEFTVKKGTRIAQLTFYKTYACDIEEVEKFDDDYPNRGGGIGHSGTS